MDGWQVRCELFWFWKYPVFQNHQNRSVNIHYLLLFVVSGMEKGTNRMGLFPTRCVLKLWFQILKNRTRCLRNGLSKSILGGGGDFLILESQYSAPRAFAANQTFAKFAFSPNFFLYLSTRWNEIISVDIWILSSDTFCRLNQLFSNSEAAMLSYTLWRSRVHWPFEQRNKTRPLIFFPVAIQQYPPW